MSAVDDLAVVVALALDTEKTRTHAEQAALLRVAAKVDAAKNALTVTNRRSGPASRLFSLVAGAQTPSWADAKTASRLEAQADRWDDQFHLTRLYDAGLLAERWMEDE